MQRLINSVWKPPQASKFLEGRVLVGKDPYGNTYYEIPPDPSRGKRQSRRMYVPAAGKDFEDEIPMEWQAWLRQRRDDPPSEAEILRNVALMELKQKKAREIEEKEKQLFPEFAKKLEAEKRKSTSTKREGGRLDFPTYDQFGRDPYLSIKQEENEKKKHQANKENVKDEKGHETKDKEKIKS
ncbi:mimitin-like protein [Dinothrombium tinctorium]|uniref:Mimitin-like protein n=1 Tax=Dinothrombium tinctorium TaxID=1965070 RepID=A0A3S3Q4X7_9ACAR|nr:mimitin-like protein [Dinothrombium tinctorium]